MVDTLALLLDCGAANSFNIFLSKRRDDLESRQSDALRKYSHCHFYSQEQSGTELA